MIGETATDLELRLVTKSPSGSAFLDVLQHDLQERAPQCRLRHAATKRYHDRFWIADEERGLFVGTSLNGIGKRYCLVDYMAPHDASEISADIRAECLFP
ncbi:MAG: hypothetical protein R2712_09300 [Vicinamibacterales bacterium]